MSAYQRLWRSGAHGYDAGATIAYATHMLGGVVVARTVGFAVAEEDRALLERLVDRFGHGNRSEFLRAAMRVMAAEERAERLREIQSRIQAKIGHPYTPEEATELVRRVLKPRG